MQADQVAAAGVLQATPSASVASATGSPLKERTLKTVPNTRTRNAGAVTTKGCPGIVRDVE